MTVLQACRAEVEKINNMKKTAVAEGRKTIEVTNCNGNKYNLYYHSGAWFGRPANRV